jgi:hypothetical protein
MNLTRLTYNGLKTYRDKLTSNTWRPGDKKLVSEESAKRLLRFVEFAKSEDGAATDAEIERALIVQHESNRKQDDERQQLESMLLTIEQMDKGALEAYALKYEVELDKRLAIGKLRAEVSTLVEQFGVR